jgi:putative heme transporter
LAVTDGVAAVAILWILGVPFAGPLAVLVFIGGFVPYLGGLVTTTVLVLATFLARGAGGVAVLLVFLAAVYVLEERVIAPRVFGPGPRLNPGLALIALAIGGGFFGIIGLFAAVPVLAAAIAFAPAVVRVLGSEPRTPSAPGVVPVWLDRLGQISWRTLVVLALLWVAAQAVVVPILSLPVVLAAIFACVLRPIEQAARRRGAGPSAAALFATVASVVVVIVVIAVTIISLVGSLPDVVGTATIGAGGLDLGVTPVALVQALGSGLTDAVAAFVANIAGVAIGVTLALVLTFFLLRDGRALWNVLLQYVPANRREPVDTVATTSASILYGSMVGTAIVSVAGAVLQFITMVLLGLPLAFPVSVLMFFGGFIPYVGSLIVTLIGLLIAVSVGSTADVILYSIYTIVFNIVQGNIVAPLVYSKTVSVHPAVVLLAAPAGAAIGGFIGMVLIVPIIAMIQQTWRIVIRLFDQDPSAAQAAAAATATSARRAPPVEGGAASAPATGS